MDEVRVVSWDISYQKTKYVNKLIRLQLKVGSDVGWGGGRRRGEGSRYKQPKRIDERAARHREI